MKQIVSFIVTLFLSVTFTCLTSTEANAQSRDRSYIREQISRRGECRNVAITKTNGDLMIYGRNGWAASGCPSGLTDALDELTEDGFRTIGEIPSTLGAKLNSTTIDVYRLKIAGSAWFISDGKSEYDYRM